jgi:hypothetical protein
VALDLLSFTCPEIICVERRNDKFPSDHLKRKDSKYNCDEYLYLLHKVVCGDFFILLVNALVQAFPESCLKRYNEGMILLHHA